MTSKTEIKSSRELDLTKLDEIFRSFTLGDRQVPDLLEATPNTRLHPSVLAGAPHHKHCRVTARALHEAHMQGGDACVYQF